MTLAAALARVAAILAAATAAGWAGSAALLPRPAGRAERSGWAFAAGCGLLAAAAAAAFAASSRPGWVLFAVLAAAAAAAGRAWRLGNGARVSGGAGAPRARGLDSKIAAASAALAVAGVVLYALRALTEPMWSNDFLAIWGLKGKTLFFAGGLPERFFRSPDLLFSHPEYPLGLPLLFAGVSSLAGRWDDHGLALFFPLAQAATVAALLGWLRRRGAPRALAWGTAAVVALFEPLYSAFLTGLAEVPLALAALLFGCALADALDGADSGAARRIALAAALLAAVKNEGLFLAAGGAAIAAAAGRRGRRAALAALAPALAVRALHWPWRSRLPLADFDFGAVSPARIGEALAAAARLPSPAVWLGIALVAVLVLCGRRDPAGDRILALVLLALAAYVLLPAAAVRGPGWLAATTLRRTASALVPLAAAGIALRLRGPFAASGVSGGGAGSGAGPATSSSRPARERRASPAS